MGTSAGWIPEVRLRGPFAVFRDAAAVLGGCPRRPTGGRAAVSLTRPRGAPALCLPSPWLPKVLFFFPPLQLGFSILYLTGLIQETIDLSTLI